MLMVSIDSWLNNKHIAKTQTKSNWLLQRCIRFDKYMYRIGAELWLGPILQKFNVGKGLLILVN